MVSGRVRAGRSTLFGMDVSILGPFADAVVLATIVGLLWFLAPLRETPTAFVEPRDHAKQ